MVTLGGSFTIYETSPRKESDLFDPRKCDYSTILTIPSAASTIAWKMTERRKEYQLTLNTSAPILNEFLPSSLLLQDLAT